MNKFYLLLLGLCLCGCNKATQPAIVISQPETSNITYFDVNTNNTAENDAIKEYLRDEPPYFPIKELNEFLVEYQLGFTLTDELANPDNEKFIYYTGIFGGFHYYNICVYGNAWLLWEGSLRETLILAGYTQTFIEFDPEAGDRDPNKYTRWYVNELDHQVSFDYDPNWEASKISFFE